MTASRGLFWWPAYSIWRREVLRFLREPSRVLGALGTPVVFWGLIGSGMGSSFQPAGAEFASNNGYLVYSFPGTIALVVLFTAVFSMISVVNDRKTGFLQGVLSAPARRSSIVVGKVLGCSTIATAQGLLLLTLAPFLGISLGISVLFALLITLALVSTSISAMGLLVAWPMDSTQGFHAVMNLVLIPMWLLSGAIFPIQGANPWVKWLMLANPLTYAVGLFRWSIHHGGAAISKESSVEVGLWTCIGVTVFFGATMCMLSTWMVSRRR